MSRRRREKARGRCPQAATGDPAARPIDLDDGEHDEWLRAVGYRQLSELLYWRWDPMGISPDHFPWNEGEYNTYALELIPLLRDRLTAAEIAGWLERAPVEHLRRPPAEFVAPYAELGDEIHRWYRDSIRVWLEFGVRDPYRLDPT